MPGEGPRGSKALAPIPAFTHRPANPSPPKNMNDSNSSGYRSWPKKYEAGGWRFNRRRKVFVADASPNPEKAFGRERKAWSFKTRVQVTTLVLFLVLGCGATLAWLLTRKPEPKTAAAPAVEVVPEFSDAAAKEKWVGPSPRRIADAFLEAKSDAERLKWVRDPEQVAPLLAEWYATGPGSREEVETVLLREVPPNSSRINLGSPAEHARFLVRMKDGERRQLSILRTPEGGKVDFACFIRHCSAPWPAILSGEVAEADVRVLVMPDAYHNFNYLDETKWVSFALSSPDMEERIHLYAPVDLPNLREMPRGWLKEPRQMFLRIKHTSRENLARKQFELVEILAPGWTQ